MNDISNSNNYDNILNMNKFVDELNSLVTQWSQENKAMPNQFSIDNVEQSQTLEFSKQSTDVNFNSNKNGGHGFKESYTSKISFYYFLK